MYKFFVTERLLLLRGLVQIFRMPENLEKPCIMNSGFFLAMCCIQLASGVGGGLNNLSKPTIDIEDFDESSGNFYAFLLLLSVSYAHVYTVNP